jgi:tRNA (guanine37-N1)-methyltransferase
MQSLGRTWLRRPDMLENLMLDADDQRLVEEFKREHKGHTHEQDH